MLTLILANSMRLFAALLPPTIAARGGAAAGEIYHDLKKRDRVRAQKHLAYAFPEKSPAWIQRTARRNFRQVGRNACVALSWVNRDEDWFKRHIYVRPDHRAHLKSLISKTLQGEGTVLAGCHFGNWESCFQSMSAVRPLATVAKKLRSPLAETLVSKVVRRTGPDNERRKVFHQEDGLRGPMRWLRQGGWMGLLHDQDISRIAGAHVPWFNILAYTPTGPASLAISTRCPMQTVFLLFLHDRWIIHLGPRIHPQRGAKREAEATRLTAASTADLEYWVRRHPEHWVWWHKRWRTRPGDVSK